jgi:hypothetical protein
MKLLPLVLLVTACTDGNSISGTWQAATRGIGDGSKPGECHGGVTVAIRAAGDLLADDRIACDEEGFELSIDPEVTKVVVTARDDWSETWSREIDVDGNTSVGTIYFDHGLLR